MATSVYNGNIHNFGSSSALHLTVNYDRRRSGTSMQYYFYITLYVADRSGNANPYGWYNNNLKLRLNLDGVEHWSIDNGGHSSAGWSDYWETGWCTVSNKTSGNTTFLLSVKDTIDGSMCQYGGENIPITVDAIPAPSGVSINPVPSRTTINLQRAWTNATSCQYNINSWGWLDEGNTYSNGVKCDGNTVSNLTPNTQYTCKVRFYNSGVGPTESNSATVTTTGNAPTLSSVTPTPSRTSCSFTYSASYDTNASFNSISIKYGTTSSYGSTSSSTTISGLSANTTYYYSVTVKDNWNRESSAVTGSFTTTGNVPSIGTVSNIPWVGFGEFNANVTYDTNASFSSIETQYGTSTSYGATSNNWRIPQSGNTLDHNTTYYYRFRVTDNFNRTSSWKSSSFTTKGNPPVISNCYSVEVGRNRIKFLINGSYDTNDSHALTEFEYGLDTNYGTQVTSTTDYVEIPSGLSPNTTYYYRARVQGTTGLYSSWMTSTFRTTGVPPVINGITVNSLETDRIVITVDNVTYDNTTFKEMTYEVYDGNTKINDNTVQSYVRITVTGSNANPMKPGRQYKLKIKIKDMVNREGIYEYTFRTKGGFKWNGKMSEGMRFNNKEVIGVKLNGIEII